MKKYNFNQYYFDNIDSPDKAYWIGFLWGDGSIYPERGDFKIELSIKDKSHLEKFKECLESTHPIKDYPNYGHGFCKELKGNTSSRFYISNKYIVKILSEKYGIVKNRTDFQKIIENVSQEYYRDLIRGLIDSDGGICFNSNKTPCEYSIYLIASESVLNFVNKWLYEQGMTKTYYDQFKRHPERDGDMKNLRITGNLRTLEIGLSLYNNSNIYLDRKYIILNQLIEQSCAFIYQNPNSKSKKQSKYITTKNKIIKILKEYNII